ncbi:MULTISPECIES: DUF1259 domain-containing protein [unclassified Cohnella]|uniref:DUF1259 domain-containing protein n=1 Tax=unclassified Cohnella TaxID=2636738 RepID=UPI001E3BD8A7|nr:MULTISPECIES: DUF1259 domain-containing protein [unclassified Cohnella]
MTNVETLCKRGGEWSVKRGVCMVEKSRPQLQVKIAGRPSHSELAGHSMWSFENLDEHAQALNLGETTLLEDEVYPFTWNLQKDGIVISALHNHWIMDRPRLMYAHYMSIENPIAFANKVANA